MSSNEWLKAGLDESRDDTHVAGRVHYFNDAAVTTNGFSLRAAKKYTESLRIDATAKALAETRVVNEQVVNAQAMSEALAGSEYAMLRIREGEESHIEIFLWGENKEERYVILMPMAERMLSRNFWRPAELEQEIARARGEQDEATAVETDSRAKWEEKVRKVADQLMKGESWQVRIDDDKHVCAYAGTTSIKVHKGTWDQQDGEWKDLSDLVPLPDFDYDWRQYGLFSSDSNEGDDETA